MRGTLFERPLEYNIEITGETWHQGDQLKGSLTVKNHGAEDASLEGKGIRLALGTAKKIKASAEDAFETLFSISSEQNAISAGGEVSHDWEMTLPKDCHITEKSSSLYICFGENGALQLNILPQQIFQQILELFENFHRFKVKGTKSKKRQSRSQNGAPTSKEFATIDGLTLSFARQEENISLTYTFKTKSLNYEGLDGINGVKVKKNQVVIEESLNPKQYLIYGNSLNQDAINLSISGVMEKVKSKNLI